MLYMNGRGVFPYNYDRCIVPIHEISAYFTQSLYVCVCLSLWLRLSFSLSVSVSPAPFLCLSVCLCLSVSVCLCLCLSFSLVNNLLYTATVSIQSLLVATVLV